MKKYAVAIAICLVALMTAIALAGAVRVMLTSTSDPNAVPGSSGRAILNYAESDDKTEIQVNCWRLTGQTKYSVWIQLDSWSCLGTFETNKKGQGHLHARVPGDQSAVPIAVNLEYPSTNTVLD